MKFAIHTVLLMSSLLGVSACGSETRRALRARPPETLSSHPPDEVDLRESEARILAIGEPTHGTREPRELQRRIMLDRARRTEEFLLLLEVCEGDAINIEDYVHGRRDKPWLSAPLVRSPIYWKLFAELRREVSAGRVVHVRGLAACNSDDHQEYLLDLIPAQHAELRAAILSARGRSAADLLQPLQEHIHNSKLAPEHKRYSIWQVYLWLQNRHAPGFPADSDFNLAWNATYVMRKLHPRARVGLLAHDGHVTRRRNWLLLNGRRVDNRRMGNYLAEWFGPEYFNVGSLVGTGRFCAHGLVAKRTRRWKLPSPSGRIEAAFPRREFILGREAFAGVEGFQLSIGNTWSHLFRGLPELGFAPVGLAEDYDAVAFFPVVHADAVPGCEKPRGR